MQDLQRFFRERWPELLIAGVWLQSVVNAVFTGRLTLIGLTLFGGLAVVALVFWLARWMRRPPRPDFGGSEAFRVERQALVFTVGGQKDTILLALRAHKPAWLGLICSRATEAVAMQVAAESGLEAEQIQKEIVDPWSVTEVREKLGFILAWLDGHGVTTEQVAVDLTGGTAIMSCGAYSLVAERQIDCQYIRSDFDENNKPIPGTQRGVFVARHERQTRRVL